MRDQKSTIPDALDFEVPWVFCISSSLWPGGSLQAAKARGLATTAHSPS